MLPSVQGLQESVHRSVMESTEEHAALVRQHAVFFRCHGGLGIGIGNYRAVYGGPVGYNKTALTT